MGASDWGPWTVGPPLCVPKQPFDLQKLDHRYSGHLGDPSRLPVGCPVSTNFLLVPGHARPCTPKISVKVASAQHNWSLEDFVPSTTAFLPGNDVKDLQFKYVQFSSHKKTPLEVIEGQISYRGNKEKPLFCLSRMVEILVSWNCCHKSMQ